MRSTDIEGVIGLQDIHGFLRLLEGTVAMVAVEKERVSLEYSRKHHSSDPAKNRHEHDDL